MAFKGKVTYIGDDFLPIKPISFEVEGFKVNVGFLISVVLG